MFVSRFSRLFGLSLLIPALSTASAVFNFDSLSTGTVTTFTYSVSGVDATFSSSDGGIFQIQVFPYLVNPLLSGNNLLDTEIPYRALDILFSQSTTSISLAFALNGGGNPTLPDPLTLTAYSGGVGGTVVGSTTALGIKPSGGTLPEGVLSFSGNSFNAVRLTSTDPFFVVDSITFGDSAVPEPASAGLALSGLAGLLVMRRRLRLRRH